MDIATNRTLRFTDAEWQELKDRAAEAGVTVKAYLAQRAGLEPGRGRGRPRKDS